MFRTVSAFAFATLSAAQSDGNPHGWDRQRRCDNTGYDPPCGICEGIGGIPTGDKNDQITLTTCEKVAEPSELSEEIQKDYPKLEKLFTQSGHHEVMISDKTNVFCKGGFPGPDSTKDHCYQEQHGSFIYDWNNYRLKMALDVKQFPSDITSDITHVKGNMWIVNDLGLGVHQCICTAPGKQFGIDIYPIKYNFMDPDQAGLNVEFVGRENLFIEYIEKTMEVDHWSQGPHHIWIDTATRRIVRMWQPWNGLEIWDPEKWDFSDNSSEFEAPPSRCIPGTLKWTIKCDDTGYPESDSSNFDYFTYLTE